MILAWIFILSLAIFCFSRIFKKGLGGDDEESAQSETKKRRTG